MINKLKFVTLLVCLYFGSVISNQQQQLQRFQAYQQQRQKSKQEPNKQDNSTNSQANTNAPQQEPAVKQDTVVKQDTPAATDVPKADIAPMVNNANKNAPDSKNTITNTTKPNATIANANAQKLKEHKRVCPLCDNLSTHCPADQERLRHGEVLPCACKDCIRKWLSEL